MINAKFSWEKKKKDNKINTSFPSFFFWCMFFLFVQTLTIMLVLRVEVQLINKELPLPSRHPGEIRACWLPPSTCPLPPVAPIAEELLGDWREQLR